MRIIGLHILLLPSLALCQGTATTDNTATSSSDSASTWTTLDPEHSFVNDNVTAPTSTGSSVTYYQPAFTISQPTGNTVWPYGEQQIISWDTSSFMPGPIIGQIDLILAPNDDNKTFTQLKALGFDLSSGNISVPVPNVRSGNYVVAIWASYHYPSYSAVFAVKNPDWTPPNVTTTTLAPANESQPASGSSNSGGGGSSVGVIAGGAVGGIVGAALVVGVMYVFRWQILAAAGKKYDAAGSNAQDFQLQSPPPKNWKYGNLDDGEEAAVPEGARL